jgi:hypothetical protein
VSIKIPKQIVLSGWLGCSFAVFCAARVEFIRIFSKFFFFIAQVVTKVFEIFMEKSASEQNIQTLNRYLKMPMKWVKQIFFGCAVNQALKNRSDHHQVGSSAGRMAIKI